MRREPLWKYAPKSEVRGPRGRLPRNPARRRSRRCLFFPGRSRNLSTSDPGPAGRGRSARARLVPHDQPCPLDRGAGARRLFGSPIPSRAREIRAAHKRPAAANGTLVAEPLLLLRGGGREGGNCASVCRMEPGAGGDRGVAGVVPLVQRRGSSAWAGVGTNPFVRLGLLAVAGRSGSLEAAPRRRRRRPGNSSLETSDLCRSAVGLAGICRRHGAEIRQAMASVGSSTKECRKRRKGDRALCLRIDGMRMCKFRLTRFPIFPRQLSLCHCLWPTCVRSAELDSPAAAPEPADNARSP